MPDHVVDPPDPAIVMELLQERALRDPALAQVLELVQWKALYLVTLQVAETNGSVTVGSDTD